MQQFYDYEAKYLSGDSSQTIIPADLPAEVIEKVREYSMRAFKALDCSGLAKSTSLYAETIAKSS